MVMQFSLKEADEFLRAVSFNEQNYDNRELYPLHYKEGFFRFVILWNEQHDHVLSFDMAVDYYKKYEEIVSVYVLKMAEKVLGSKESLEDGKDLKKYKNMKYYCDLLESIWKEMCQWKHPYTSGNRIFCRGCLFWYLMQKEHKENIMNLVQRICWNIMIKHEDCRTEEQGCVFQ